MAFWRPGRQLRFTLLLSLLALLFWTSFDLQRESLGRRKPRFGQEPSLTSNARLKTYPHEIGGNGRSFFKSFWQSIIHDHGKSALAKAPDSTMPNVEHEEQKVMHLPGKRIDKFPVAPEDLIRLPLGAGKPIPRIQTARPEESVFETTTRLNRQLQIKKVFEQDWDAYKKFAWMHDELKPVSNTSSDPFGGWGATLIDALDTLIIMDLVDDYRNASAAVATIDFTFTTKWQIPVFETTIRYLGGLLAAYDLSEPKDQVMLNQSVALADFLMGAFDTHNRMPILQYNFRRDSKEEELASVRAVLAELGSLSVEFTRLAQVTGDNRYFDAVQRITNELEKSADNMVIVGLWPSLIDISGCQSSYELSNLSSFEKKKGESVRDFSWKSSSQIASTNSSGLSGTAVEERGIHNKAYTPPADGFDVRQQCQLQGIKPSSNWKQQYTFGSMADSFYEYLVKEYLLLGGALDQYEQLYTKAAEAGKAKLLFRPLAPSDPDILFGGEVAIYAGATPVFIPTTQHLTCFVGGMFGLASKTFGRPQDLPIAEKLTNACVWAYNATASGIMPEAFTMRECRNQSCRWTDFLKTDEEGIALTEVAANNLSGPNSLQGAQKSLDKISHQLLLSNSSQPFELTKRFAQNEAARLAEANFYRSQHEKAVATSLFQGPKSPMKRIDDRRYLMRPEAIESVWYMYRLTGDKEWQEKGWKMWQSVEKATRTISAHSAIQDVTSQLAFPTDSLESFWFAETLKYYFLLFSDFDLISLDEWYHTSENSDSN